MMMIIDVTTKPPAETEHTFLMSTTVNTRKQMKEKRVQSSFQTTFRHLQSSSQKNNPFIPRTKKRFRVIEASAAGHEGI